MKLSSAFYLIGALIVSVGALVAVKFLSLPVGISQSLSTSGGSDQALWQVQTTFLSVGFAGLAIAAQLFTEAPLAIGASRSRVLEHVKADWFVGVGLVGNIVIALEVIWLQSDLGVLIVALVWFIPTLIMLIVSTMRLLQLFSNPSRLDELVKMSLTNNLTTRLNVVAQKYADAKQVLQNLQDPLNSTKLVNPSMRVPVPEAGRVIRMIRPKIVQQAINSLGLRATEHHDVQSDPAKMYHPPQIVIDIEPGDRTRFGETAFRVISSDQLESERARRIALLLQSSIVFESPGAVTPDEEIDREIASLKDAIGTSLRSGAFATAERALDLLSRVVRGVWMAEPAASESTRRISLRRRDWLFRSLGEVEQDVLLSPRAALMFISAATTRALEAPRTDSTEYLDQCLASFRRLWFNILRYGDPEFDSIPSQILLSVHNLTTYSYAVMGRQDELQAQGTWTMVELVKIALDAKRPEAARNAAEVLNGLFEFDGGSKNRAHVRGGQLVLSGWLDYLARTQDERHLDDLDLREVVTPRGSVSEIIEARHIAEISAERFSRWDWWEIKSTISSRAEVRQLSSFIDRAQVEALSLSHGQLPPLDEDEEASEYKRFLRILDNSERDLTHEELLLKKKLTEEIQKWEAQENERLLREPISALRVKELHDSLRTTLSEGPRLAAELPFSEDLHSDADASQPILGMNIRVPRHYLVERVFHHTYADPLELGRIIAQGFIEAEDRKIVEALRSIQVSTLEPTIAAISKEIEDLGDAAERYILITPYGGMGNVYEWHSFDFMELLNRVTHIEVGALHNEAILFERRQSLESYRKPERKEDLSPITGTSIAFGMFEDVEDGDEPQVRLETGEYFVVWQGGSPHIVRFGTE